MFDRIPLSAEFSYHIRVEKRVQGLLHTVVVPMHWAKDGTSGKIRAIIILTNSSDHLN